MALVSVLRCDFNLRRHLQMKSKGCSAERNLRDFSQCAEFQQSSAKLTAKKTRSTKIQKRGSVLCVLLRQCRAFVIRPQFSTFARFQVFNFEFQLLSWLF